MISAMSGRVTKNLSSDGASSIAAALMTAGTPIDMTGRFIVFLLISADE